MKTPIFLAIPQTGELNKSMYNIVREDQPELICGQLAMYEDDRQLFAPTANIIIDTHELIAITILVNKLSVTHTF
jgi:hypothetical protein